MESRNPDECDDHTNKIIVAAKEGLKPEEREDYALIGSRIKLYAKV